MDSMAWAPKGPEDPKTFMASVLEIVLMVLGSSLPLETLDPYPKVKLYMQRH